MTYNVLSVTVSLYTTTTYMTLRIKLILNLIILICYYVCNVHCCTWNVYLALRNKHGLHFSMAACTCWPTWP